MTKFMQKRDDAVGLFWDERVEIREKKERIKRTPPDRFWEKEDYLPQLDDALNFDANLLTDDEIIALAGKDGFVFDIESYPNYFLAAFKSISTGKRILFISDDMNHLDRNKLRWVLENFLIVGFASANYDLPVLTFVCEGANHFSAFEITKLIIEQQMPGWQLLKMRRVKKLNVNHIDLVEVAPLRASLKMYGGRLHTRRMQDLPFKPGTYLTPEQKLITLWYCANDLDQTIDIYHALSEQLALRKSMSQEYGIDLRSKSDAQIAEAVILTGLGKSMGNIRAPEIPYGQIFRYNCPPFIKFKTAYLNSVLEKVKQAQFVVDDKTGHMAIPKSILELKIHIGASVYQFGMGGLHSTEEKIYHRADENNLIVDRDVISFYPYIILNMMLYPRHLGPMFLKVYGGIVERRVQAKKNNEKEIADSLKITINGTFGKLSSPYSNLYSPDLGMHVTITGQLLLLMLIETIELQGLPVLSANTDGFVFRCPKNRKTEIDQLIKNWEKSTGFETEETLYRAIYSRDVNNYIAITTDGKVKAKGVYSDPWSDPKLAIFRFHKNPENQICKVAVREFLLNNTPIDETIMSCKDIRQFVSVRKVKGGAVKGNMYLGSSTRWYYAKGDDTEIVYASNGNKVPKSDGGKPLMFLPDEFPQDVDYDRYILETKSLLSAVGVEV